MIMKTRSFTTAFIAVLFIAAAGRATAQTSRPADVAAEVKDILDAPLFTGASWGILVVDAKSGETLVAKDAEKLFCPASVTKLYSCAAMLDAFGADYRFKTPVYRRTLGDGPGGSRDDLILRASGDPNLTGRLTADKKLLFRDVDHIYSLGSTSALPVDCDPLEGLRELARAVRAAGVTRVDDVLVDDRLFDIAQGSGSGPGTVTPVMVNDNVVDILFAPGVEAGAPAVVTLRPASEIVNVDLRVTTVAKGEKTAVEVERLGKNRFVATGVIALDHEPFAQILIVDDPTAYARALFIRRLRAEGVSVKASTLSEMNRDLLPAPAEYATLQKVAEHESPPLIDALTVCLKVSHNLDASLWPMLIAAKNGERTLDQGMRRIGQGLAKLGVNVRAISFTGAAGGMPGDMTTPKETVALLRAMAARSDGELYRKALPALGVDGTLAKAVEQTSPARGRVQAKTGTMGYDNKLDGTGIMRAKALAGYVTALSGREIVFAVFLNNVPAREGFDATVAGKTLGKVAERIFLGY